LIYHRQTGPYNIFFNDSSEDHFPDCYLWILYSTTLDNAVAQSSDSALYIITQTYLDLVIFSSISVQNQNLTLFLNFRMTLLRHLFLHKSMSNWP